MSKDPYKYFRVEARELVQGLAQGVLELEKGAVSKEVVARLLRLAHTLKGAARVVKQAAVADSAHAIEGLLAPHREGGGSLPRDRASELLRLIDSVNAQLRTIEGTEETRSPGAAGASPGKPDGRSESARDPSSGLDPRLETVRIDVREMDSLVQGLSEAAIKASALRKKARALEDRELLASVERLERELEQARDMADRLRLVPANGIFPALERAVRDAAQSLDRNVDFEATGGESRLDAHVLSAVAEALLHVVRNAVAHGIEPAAERVAAGKPPAGRVQLSVARRASRVTFTCRDDGRGIDVEAIRRVAVRRGLISTEEAANLRLPQAVSLIFRGGVSTAGTVSELAGRGVGLDVVREVASRLKGEVAVRSERGTTVEITVPVSVSSLPALLVEAGATVASIPLDGVVETVRISEREIVRSGEADSIVHQGAGIPFLPLVALLGGSAARHPGPARAWSAVIVRSASQLAAVGVDRLLGAENVVVRPLPALVGPVPAVAGAAFDSEGNPQLVLDPASLVDIARTQKRVADPAPRRRPPVLVIDDSLTTRMLEQSILESAGYEVELATSAEEGIEKARMRRFGVFVVDVEMPGMDGYEFVRRTRSDPVLGQTPAILVTSRGSAEDRRRGAEAGAYAYIVKGEFDQGRLLRAIGEVVG